MADPLAGIRPMQAGDVATLRQMASLSLHAPHWLESAYLDALQSSPRRLALVAEVAGEISGFAIVSLIPPEAELESIVVDPKKRRQGIAQTLLNTIRAELKQQKVMELLLEVRASNHPARALYRHVGFQEVAVRSRYYADPIEDAILMKQPLV